MTKPNGRVHPAAEVFPLIEGPAFDELVADVQANGLREPCWLDSDGTLIDGRNRLRACEAAGIEPRYQVYRGDDVVGLIVSLNLKRRHLSEDERAFLATRLIPHYEQQGREAKAKAGASAAPGSPKKDSAGLHYLSQDNAKRATHKAAADVNVAPRKVAQAKRIAEQAPDLIEPVVKGQMSMSKAETIVRNRASGIADSDGDAWYTPRWLFDQLGVTFDVDVCAPRNQDHRTAPAAHYYTEDDDGLQQQWHGLVWCNPPYSTPESWADRMIEHKRGLMLTHMPNNARWAVRAQRAATAVRLIQSMHFTRPNGADQRPGYSLMLLAYGQQAAQALKSVDGEMVGPLWVPL